MPQNQNERPGDKGWTLTIEEHEAIQGLGRILHKDVLEFAKTQPGGTMHMKIVVGAIGYLKEIFEEKKLALSLDVTMCQKLIEENNLGELINEPYYIPDDVRVEVRRQEEEARKAKENTEVIEGTPIDENQTSIPLENAPVEGDEEKKGENNS
jgi:hypothetical protein